MGQIFEHPVNLGILVMQGEDLSHFAATAECEGIFHSLTSGRPHDRNFTAGRL